LTAEKEECAFFMLTSKFCGVSQSLIAERKPDSHVHLSVLLVVWGIYLLLERCGR